MHLISLLGVIVNHLKAGSGYRGRFRLQISILHDVALIEWVLLLLLVPLLVLDRGEKQVRLSEKRERDRLVCINLFLPG